MRALWLAWLWPGSLSPASLLSPAGPATPFSRLPLPSGIEILLPWRLMGRERFYGFPNPDAPRGIPRFPRTIYNLFPTNYETMTNYFDGTGRERGIIIDESALLPDYMPDELLH